MECRDFLKPESKNAIMARRFPILYSFDYKSLITLGPFRVSVILYFYFIYPFSLSVMFPLFLYFTPKLFCFFCNRLLVCLRAFSSELLIKFSFIYLECPILIVKSRFFHQYLLIYFFKLHH